MKIETSKVHSLKRSTTQEEMDRQLREVSKAYEKHFLREMVKAMRGSVQESELVPKSMGERIYSEKLDDQYVETWGDAGGIGLADLIYQDVQTKIFGVSAPAAAELPKVHMPLPSGKAPILKINEEGFELEDQPALEPSAQTAPVLAPMPGTVEEVLKSGGRQFVRLNHGQHGVSLLSFVGDSAPLTRGSKVESSERLGSVTTSERAVHWKWLRAKV